MAINNGIIVQFGWHPSSTNDTTLPIAFTTTYSVVRDLNYGSGTVSWEEANGYNSFDCRQHRTLTWFSTSKWIGDWLAIGF